MLATMRRHRDLLDLLLKAAILMMVLATIWQASTARAAFIPDRKTDPNPVRSGNRDESIETRLARSEWARETTDARVALLERQLIEVMTENRKHDRAIVSIEAVAAANTNANWIVGGGFVAQFLFSLMRYLRVQSPAKKVTLE